VAVFAAGLGHLAAPSLATAPVRHDDGAAPVVRTPRLRTVDLRLAQVIRRGYVQSATFKMLVDTVESSSVIVYLERHLQFGGLEAARLRLAGEAGGHRFLKVSLNASLTDRELVVYVAHELQHVREIAEQPHVLDEKSLRDLYCRIGRLGSYGFETDAARRVAQQVADELAAAR